MSRTTKRFLSILLTAAMVLSLGITGWAIDDEDDIIIVDPSDAPATSTDKHVTAGFEGGTELELEEIDPSTLNIPKLGETEEEDILTAEELPFGLNDVVRVSIVLEQPATMSAGYSTQNIADNRGAMAYRETLKQQQAGVEAAIASAGVTMNVKWNLTLAVNIISAEVRYGDIGTIETVPGVKAVWLENRYEPQVDEINSALSTEYMVGATALWEEGYTGAGSRVAIIDSGTNPAHISFDPEALEYALAEDGGDYNLLTWDEISAVAADLNAPISEKVYRNTKIPYAYNYIDGNYTVDHYHDNQTEHGSHVSGIAAANRYVKIDGEFVDSATKFYAVGVAPDAQILTMKVFGVNGGAYDSDYMAAIEDAIILKADSINLSLGSSAPGFTFSNGFQDVMDGLIECGSVVSISAGNAYNWADFLPSGVPYLYLEDVSLHTGGSPGSFANSLCVAAAQNVGEVGTPLLFNDELYVGYIESTESNEGVAYGNPAINTIAGTYDFVYIDATGAPEHYEAVNAAVALEGKIVIVNRGELNFSLKGNNAIDYNPAALIIANNQPGNIRMDLSDYTGSFPMVTINLDKAEAIKDASEKHELEDGLLYYTGTVTITDEAIPVVSGDRENAAVTDFSSWGVPGSLIMKPEITAPGGNIWSVNGLTDDSFEDMSGTSMAAPHIAGMAALLGQYIRENDLEAVTNQNRRTLINSLLMSTATPMIVDGAYLPILQQGSGLGDTLAATEARSYILMDETATSGAADGKVKVELGQDAGRSGEYSFGFTVNNFSDTDLVYDLYTDMFTQYPYYDSDSGNLYMLTDTMLLEPGEDFDVSYDFPHVQLNGHDVNMDGVTDKADAQALLDYLTDLVDGETLNLAVGEMDGVEGISSYDAQLLLEWEANNNIDGLVVPAGDSVYVTVTITYSEDLKEFLDDYYVGGAYVEGFTYLLPSSETDDGAFLDVVHSIPILGFYGSWTDASMFDCVSPIETAYGSTKVSYTGNPNTNYLTVNYGSGNTVFMGNPYAVEDEFPADRLAINGATKLVNFKYNLIRNAGTAGWLALDQDGNILKDGGLTSQVMGAWYYVNGQEWQNIKTLAASINNTPMSFGLREDSVFTLGYFAVPEYYGMMLHPGENINTVSAEEISQLLADGELGDGAYLGYTFTVDNTAPTAEAKVSDDGTQITVTAEDNNYVAYIAIMDINGNVVYKDEVPTAAEKGEKVEVTFDISELDLPNGVAIFVGDYAANEKAYLIVFDPDKPVTTTKEVYMLTDTLEVGGEYIISNVNSGAGYALTGNGANRTVGATPINVIVDEIGAYIPVEEAAPSFVWTTEEGIAFANNNDGTYLGFYPGYPYVTWVNPDWADGFSYVDNKLTFDGTNGIFWNGDANNFYYGTADALYLFEKTVVEIKLDTQNASAVSITPEAATLILDVIPTVQLLATVEPVVLPDRTVTWRSSDETVATVDAEGLVTAVAVGTATITATSNQTPTVSAAATISVTSGESMDAVVYGQVAFGADDIEYGIIDLNDMTVTDLSDNAMFSAFYGGGRSGDYIYGNDIDNDFHRYNAEDGYAYDSEAHFEIDERYAVLDAAAFPAVSFADYSGVTDDNPDPQITDFKFDLSAVAPNGLMTVFKGSVINYFDLSSVFGNLIGITFAGYDFDEETEQLAYYYVLLAEDGSLYLFLLSPNPANGQLGARYGKLAHINVLTIGDDLTAYSMSYYYNEDERVEGVFIADSTIGAIYFVNLGEKDGDGEVDAHYVGKIDGATSLSALSDFNYDTDGDLGTISIGQADGGNIIELPDAPTALRDVPLSGETLYSQTAELLEKESADYEIIDIGTEDDDIVVVGSLNAAHQQPVRTPVKPDAAVWSNPDTFEDEGVYVLLTTPNADGTAIAQQVRGTELNVSSIFSKPVARAAKANGTVYNGFMTVTYDPEVMTYDYFFAHYGIELKSLNVDEENGVIKFAYASLNPVSEGVIGMIHFTTPTDNTEIEVTTEELNDNLSVDDTTVIEINVQGYLIDIEDHTKGGATTSIEAETRYKGEVEFTVNADQAVLVAVKNGEDDYTRLYVQGSGDNGYTFKIKVTADTTIALAYKGDANLNGKLETKDGTIIKRASIKAYEFTSKLAEMTADVNGNGKTETKDGTMVARVLVGTYEIAW